MLTKRVATRRRVKAQARRKPSADLACGGHACQTGERSRRATDVAMMLSQADVRFELEARQAQRL